MPFEELPAGPAGGCFTVYAALKRHKPFNLHHFRPKFFCPFSSASGLANAVIPSDFHSFCPLSPNRPKQGRMDASRSSYPLFPNKGTRRRTNAHRGITERCLFLLCFIQRMPPRYWRFPSPQTCSSSGWRAAHFPCCLCTP